MEEPAKTRKLANLAFFVGLGISILVVRQWGQYLAVRLTVGVAWGLYILLYMWPDLIHARKFLRRPKERNGD